MKNSVNFCPDCWFGSLKVLDSKTAVHARRTAPSEKVKSQSKVGAQFPAFPDPEGELEAPPVLFFLFKNIFVFALEKKIQKKASAIKAKTVFQLVISSPAIKGRFEADPYDDCLMEDFGDLADHFYDGSDVEEMHQKLESAVQKAWEFISENLMDDDIDEKELRHLVMGR